MNAERYPAEPGTARGHVPNHNLGIYRYWAHMARDADRIGDQMGNLNEYRLSGACWEASLILKARADEYRVIL